LSSLLTCLLGWSTGQFAIILGKEISMKGWLIILIFFFHIVSYGGKSLKIKPATGK
jgi:hypothetical protein